MQNVAHKIFRGLRGPAGEPLAFLNIVKSSSYGPGEVVDSCCNQAISLIDLPMSVTAIFQQLPAYCDDFTTVNNVTPAADTGGAVDAVNVPVEALISKPATVLVFS